MRKTRLEVFFTYDDPRRFRGHNRWWASFPKIESRRLIPEPFGPPPIYKIGDLVRLRLRPMLSRRVLKVEWHAHRYQWVYVIETSAMTKKCRIDPYWFADKLEIDTALSPNNSRMDSQRKPLHRSHERS